MIIFELKDIQIHSGVQIIQKSFLSNTKINKSHKSKEVKVKTTSNQKFPFHKEIQNKNAKNFMPNDQNIKKS